MKSKSVKLLLCCSSLVMMGCGTETKQKFVPPNNADGAAPAGSVGSTKLPVVESKESPVVETIKSPVKAASKTTGDSAADKIQQQQIDILLEMADAIETGAAEFELSKFRTRQADLYKQFQELNLPATEVFEVLQRHQADLDKANQRLMDVQLARAKKMTDEAMKNSN